MPNVNGNVPIWTIALAVVAFVAACLSSSVVLRCVAVLPLVLLLPGFSVMRAAGERRFDLETVVLSVGLSMGITVLGGLALSAVNGLTLIGWAALLSSITVAASLYSSRSIGKPDFSTRLPSLHVRPVDWGAGLLAVVVGIGAVALARNGAESQHEYAFSEFWLVPGTASSGNLVTVGIRNAEAVLTTYEIALLADGATISRRSGIALQAGETWSDVLPLNGRLGLADRVEARLFREDAPDTVYRKVWLSRSAASKSLKKDQP